MTRHEPSALRGDSQQPVDVLVAELTFAAINCSDPRSLANHEVFALEAGDVVLGDATA